MCYLKIYGEIVRDIADDPLSHAIVEAVNGVAKVQGIRTLAEQVEKQEILDRLRSIGVDYAQGYAIEEPIPISNCLGTDGDA